MYTIYGIPASSGVSTAKALILTRSVENPAYERPWSLDPDAESSFYKKTLRIFSERLRQTANPALDHQRDLYGATAGYLTDASNTDAVLELIRSGQTATVAARSVYIGQLKNFNFVKEGDPYLMLLIYAVLSFCCANSSNPCSCGRSP